jgi:hypothetical protein
MSIFGKKLGCTRGKCSRTNSYIFIGQFHLSNAGKRRREREREREGVNQKYSGEGAEE